MSADKIVCEMGKIGVFLSHYGSKILKRGTHFKQVSISIIQVVTEIFVFQQPPQYVSLIYLRVLLKGVLYMAGKMLDFPGT